MRFPYQIICLKKPKKSRKRTVIHLEDSSSTYSPSDAMFGPKRIHLPLWSSSIHSPKKNLKNMAAVIFKPHIKFLWSLKSTVNWNRLPGKQHIW